MTVTVRLEEPSGGGSGVAEDLSTAELDTTLYLAPDGAGGVHWVPFPPLVPPNVEDLPTAELDTTLYLAPDGAGGLVWSPFPIVDHSALSGVTPDQHHAQQHVLGGADHAADTLVDINTKVSDYDLASVTKARMDFYVRDDIGNDANPGTLLLPLKTIDEAERRIPYIVAYPGVIHLGTHPAGGWIMPTFRARLLLDHIVVVGDGAGEAGVDGFTEVVASTVALAGSGNRKVVSAALGAVSHGGFGDLSCLTIEILSGAAIGDRRTIRRNTATDIIPVAAFSAAVAPGDSYRIVRPAIDIITYVDWNNNSVLIRGTASSNRVFDNIPSPTSDIGYPSLVLCNLNINVNNAGTYAQIILDNANCLLLGCTSEVNIGLTGVGTYQFGVETYYGGTYYGDAANEGVPLGRIIFGCPSSMSWSGWGLGSPNANANVLLYSADVCCKGFLCCGNIETSGGILHVIGGCAYGAGGLNVDEHVDFFSRVHIDATYETIELGGTGTTTGVRACNTCSCILDASGLDGAKVIARGNSYGILGYRGGLLQINSIHTGDVEIYGAVGIAVYQRSEVCVVSTNLPLVTATSSHDFTVNGGLAFHPIADLVMSSHFHDSLYGSIYHTGDL